VAEHVLGQPLEVLDEGAQLGVGHAAALLAAQRMLLLDPPALDDVEARRRENTSTSTCANSGA